MFCIDTPNEESTSLSFSAFVVFLLLVLGETFGTSRAEDDALETSILVLCGACCWARVSARLFCAQKRFRSLAIYQNKLADVKVDDGLVY